MNEFQNALYSTEVYKLARLACNKNVRVRAYVAQNTNSSPDILTRLSQDEHEWVRKSVALNPNTPKEVRFLLLLEHPGWVNA
jgi:3-methyladenine DNA glycosylase AlkC